MIKTQPIKKYIAPAIVATSIAVFSPVLIDEASAHGGPDIEETSNTEVNTSSSSESSEAVSGGATLLGNVDVTNLQEQLNENGQDIAVDGINGKDTKKSVKAVQEDNGIQVDGIVGDDTKDALGLSTASASNDEAEETTDSNEDAVETEKEEEAQGTEETTEANEGDPKAPNKLAEEDQEGEEEGTTTFTNAGNDATTGDSVTKAYSLVGTTYVFGGYNPETGLDSSGFINAVFSDKDLERTHEGMWASNGTQVDDPQPGDVVFFEGTYKDGVSHSGVYVGNGNMVHAGNEDTGVEETSMEIGYWADKYIGAKRF